MKKISVFLLGVLALLGSTFSGNLVNAAEIEGTSDSTSVAAATTGEFVGYDLSESPYSIVLDDNNVIFFETKEDYDAYQEAFNTAHVFDGYGYITKPTEVSSYRDTNHWVGYHSGTPAWTPASSYTLTQGKTYSASGSYEYSGFTVDIGFSYSFSVATTIPADSSRLSRLGVWGDYTFTKYKYTEYYQGVPTGKAPTYGVVATRHSWTIKPKYK